MTTVAIMQPTYLPWIGYFGLMDAVDEFILLDSVQFARRSWQQRNQIKLADKTTWLTVPVISKGLRDQEICHVTIDPSSSFVQKHIRTIEAAYSKAPYFDLYAEALFQIMLTDHKKLSELNIALIRFIKNALNIDALLKCSSDLENVGSKAELLAHICTQVGATEYLSPPGSKEYLGQSNIFKEKSISIKYFKFSHPEYPQRYDPFVANMSVIDLLFNTGPTSLDYIRSECGVEKD